MELVVLHQLNSRFLFFFRFSQEFERLNMEEGVLTRIDVSIPPVNNCHSEKPSFYERLLTFSLNLLGQLPTLLIQSIFIW